MDYEPLGMHSTASIATKGNLVGHTTVIRQMLTRDRDDHRFRNKNCLIPSGELGWPARGFRSAPTSLGRKETRCCRVRIAMFTSMTGAKT